MVFANPSHSAGHKGGNEWMTAWALNRAARGDGHILADPVGMGREYRSRVRTTVIIIITTTCYMPQFSNHLI